MHLTPMPSALLARRLRSGLCCQKQVGAGDRGRRSKTMSCFLDLFFIITFTFLLSAQAGDPTTPIIVDIVGSSRPEIQMAGRQMTETKFAALMKDTSEKFGDADPVIIRFAPLAHFLFAGKLALLATETHKSVFLAINDPDSKDGSPLLIPISRDKTTFKLLPTSPTSTLADPGHIPRSFEAPRDPAAEQWKRIQKINNGELP